MIPQNSMNAAFRLNRQDALRALADGKWIVLMPNGVNPIRFADDGFEQWIPGLGWSPMPHSAFNRYKRDYYYFVEPNDEVTAAS